jgi:hypothetical protein
MNRGDAISYLMTTLGPTAGERGVTSPTQDFIWETATDDALLALSVAATDLQTKIVATTDVIGYRALLTYYGLVRLHETVLASVDVSIDGPQTSKRFSQYVAALERRIALAAQAASSYATAGPLVTESGYGEFGSFNTGYMTLSGSEFA